jgi:PAS domain S-box-containing protein
MPRRLRIIFIEDNIDDLELVVGHLRRDGLDLDVTRVDDAPGLRKALERRDWDVVISDYNLPGFNAPAALSIIHASGQDLPFIVVTGSIGEERAVEMMRAGADDFLLKEQLGRLSSAIERSIGDARVRADRTRMVRLLRSANHELTTLVDATPLAIIGISPNGKVRSWNPAAERLLGWTAAETVDRGVSALDDGGVEGFAALRAQVAQGRTFTSVAARLRHKDGQAIEVSLSMAALGAGGGCLAVAEDTSEKRRLETMLLHAQKLEAVGLLTGSVAHDFNNLLSVMLGYGEMLVRIIPPASRGHSQSQEICNAAERASTLTRQLLAFSRKQVLRTQVVQINAIVQQMAVMLRRLLGERIRMRLDLVDGGTPVSCDPGQIEMVIMNLAVNARDAMPAGGELRISTSIVEPASGDQPAIAGLEQRRCLLLAVSDAGTGIDPAIQARIFEPFFTTKERGRGTGLGLATVFSVIKQCGGHVGVLSALGQGTSFRIHLPLTSQQQPTASAPPPTHADLEGDETILLVEDDDAFRQLIAEYLREHGYRVLPAASGETALACLSDHPGSIHVLLTDVILPGISGVELSRLLANDHPEARILFMSGYTEDAIDGQGLPADGFSLLEKPFRPQVLLAKIRDALAGPSPSGVRPVH